ncbi:alpha/beta hydrolase [Sneathiella sp.]|uniref:alpha/beta hydrolase n=1 Tax=Sneathiella sp. TaxID=1964365 RepID=UPI002FE389BC
MRLLAKTYWHGTQIRFRDPVEGVTGIAVQVDAEDKTRVRGTFWRPDNNPKPKVVVIAAHPRGDFSEHHAFPGFLKAGYGCMGANMRSINNDSDCLHEKLVLDIAAYMKWLKENGAEKIILLGNSGGGALFSFYQAQAVAKPEDRIKFTPGGRPTGLEKADLIPGDAIIYMAAHTGEGKIINEVIDPSVSDEHDPLKVNPEFDMYDPANGFKPAPQWVEYSPEFVKKFRDAQIARVQRLDSIAHEWIKEAADAARIHGSEYFEDLPAEVQRRVLRQEYFEPVMVIYRTMANLHYADKTLDPSPRGYGSIMSPRPDLMNFQRFGFARVMTPHGWLSTWSGLSSNACIELTGPSITIPAVVIHAGKDLEVFPATHSKVNFNTIKSTDKEYWDIPEALHYFEPDEGDNGNETLNRMLDRLVAWTRARFPL